MILDYCEIGSLFVLSRPNLEHKTIQNSVTDLFLNFNENKVVVYSLYKKDELPEHLLYLGTETKDNVLFYEAIRNKLSAKSKVWAFGLQDRIVNEHTHVFLYKTKRIHFWNGYFVNDLFSFLYKKQDL